MNKISKIEALYTRRIRNIEYFNMERTIKGRILIDSEDLPANRKRKIKINFIYNKREVLDE